MIYACMCCGLSYSYGQLKEKGVNFCLTASEEKECYKTWQRKAKIRCCGKIGQFPGVPVHEVSKTIVNNRKQ